MRKILLICVALFSIMQINAQNQITPEIKGDTIIYRLTIDYITVNFSGKDIKAMAINNSIPAPTLEFEEGKYAVIYVTNKMEEESSVHWHGLILPNFQDGVPYLNTPPIEPNATQRFEFPLIQSGTYWYHSHTGLQEQRGVYGGIIIKPKTKTFDYNYDLSIVLSDWVDEKPKSVLKNLKRGNDWYSIKRKTTQPLSKTIPQGAFGAQLKLWSKRMPGIDISDVAFEAFLSNGKRTQTYPQYKPGDKVRVRLINASAATYFWLTVGGEYQLISADGIDVVPVSPEKVLHAIAETYDYIVTIPESGALEILASAQDGSGFTSIILGSGTVEKAKVFPKPDYISLLKKMGNMKMGEDQKESKEPMQEMKAKSDMDMGNMNEKMKMNDEFSYDYLKSPTKTTINSDLPVNEIELNLTGNMLRYIWSINDKVLSDVDKIKIKRGEKARITLNNKTMMHHPMHLHGHFFRVINASGEYSPLKHTVNVPPMGRVTIEFDANEHGDWFFHCHILYHAKAGMARVFSYGDPRDIRLNNSPLSEVVNEDKSFYKWGELSVASHMASLNYMISNTYNQVNFSAEYGWNKNMEIVLSYERYLSNYFRVYGGVDAENEIRDSLGVIETVGRVGARWLLPFFIESDLSVDHLLRPQVAFSTTLLLLSRLELQGSWEMVADFGVINELGNNIDWTQDYIWNIGLEFVLAKNWSLIGSYDNRFGAGGGISIRF